MLSEKDLANSLWSLLTGAIAFSLMGVTVPLWAQSVINILVVSLHHKWFYKEESQPVIDLFF